MSPTDQLTRLGALTELTLNDERARLAALEGRAKALREMLKGLDQQRRDRAESANFDPAQMVGQDMVWQSWVDSRKSLINQELSRTLASIEGARGRTALAFGRDQVVHKLCVKTKLDARTARNARDST